jgi:tRNA G18 (ribose-2'-O)-methylase SpoU
VERSFEPGEFYQGVGVGPHLEPHPVGAQYDPELLHNGDRRNVADEFRYLTVDAIRKILSARRIPLEIAIENWQHDLNIGSLVRTANAFNVNLFHIIGNKHWNQHGALMTDKYIDLQHHSSVADFAEDCRNRNLPIVGFENIEGAKRIETSTLPEKCVLLFGNEGLGLSDEAIKVCNEFFEIEQNGSVRSMNASVAGAIAMYAWRIQHRSKDV